MTNKANGFTIVGHIGMSDYVVKTIKCYVPSTETTDLFVGDQVILAANGSSVGCPCVADAAAGNTPFGVIVGVEYNPADLSKRYLPGSTGGYVFVCIDPNVIMEVQGNGTVEDGDIGANASLVAGGGDTTTQTSGMQINISTAAATSTLVFKILGLANRPDNTLGDYAKLLVTYNVHVFRATGTTGVHA